VLMQILEGALGPGVVDLPATSRLLWGQRPPPEDPPLILEPLQQFFGFECGLSHVVALLISAGTPCFHRWRTGITIRRLNGRGYALGYNQIDWIGLRWLLDFVGVVPSGPDSDPDSIRPHPVG
jgi:hypothetical protein